MAAEWFYLHSGNIVGPLTTAELRQHALALWVAPEDQVRRGTDGSWMLATKVKGLFDPPPEPPAAVLEKPTQDEPAATEAAAGAVQPKQRVKAELTAPYEYKMVEVAPRLEFVEGEKTKGKLAVYFEEIVNQYASQGWEFYRVDSMSKTIHPGCLSMLFGEWRSRTIVYYVVTFRRPR